MSSLFLLTVGQQGADLCLDYPAVAFPLGIQRRLCDERAGHRDTSQAPAHVALQKRFLLTGCYKSPSFSEKSTQVRPWTNSIRPDSQGYSH